jgi:uncharacterized protein (UPF0333 family)
MRAQISFEFMIVFSVLLTISMIVFAISSGTDLNLAQIRDSVAALRNAHSAAAAINYVYLAGDGASYNFTPANIMNGENITLSGHAVTSWRPYATISAPLLDARVNASSLGRGDIIISNNGGEIDIGE